MKLFIICSKRFYGRIAIIKEELEKLGHEVVLPNCYDNPNTEDEYRFLGEKNHAEFKKRMFKQSENTTKNVDGVLVLNFDKEKQKNYIGGATFLEMYVAFRLEKDIYLWNNIPNNNLSDEIAGFSPIIINGDIEKIPMVNRVQQKILTYLGDFKDNNYITNCLPIAIAETFKLENTVCQTEINSLQAKELINMHSLKQFGVNIDYYKINDKGLECLENNFGKQNSKVKSL